METKINITIDDNAIEEKLTQKIIKEVTASAYREISSNVSLKISELQEELMDKINYSEVSRRIVDESSDRIVRKYYIPEKYLSGLYELALSKVIAEHESEIINKVVNEVSTHVSESIYKRFVASKRYATAFDKMVNEITGANNG